MKKEYTLTLQSSSFTNGGAIPQKYTCDGENISPQLGWQGGNTTTIQSYVVIVDDPDAQHVVGKTFVHWIVLLPNQCTQLPEGISSSSQSRIDTLDSRAKELPNDFGKTNYGGPCPPHGTHTYRFTVFATNQPIESMNGPFFSKPFTAEDFETMMADSIIGHGQLTGKYTRHG